MATTYTHNGAPFYPNTEVAPPVHIEALGQSKRLIVYGSGPPGPQPFSAGDDFKMAATGAGGNEFAGTIKDVAVKGYTRDGQYLQYKITCVDYSESLRKLLYTGTHAYGTPLANLFTDMRDQTQYDTLGISNPTSFPSGAFREFSGTWENVPVANILDEIADFFSFRWTVSVDRGILLLFEFFNEVVDGASVLSGRDRISITRSNAGYANQVTIIGGDGQGREITESVTRKTDEPYFKLTHRVAAVASATLGGTSATIGQRGVERSSTFDLLWTEGDDVIEVQSPSGGSSDVTMTVTYTPIAPIRITLEDPEGINRYGIVADKPIQNSNIRTPEKALEIAEARLYYTSQYRAEKIKVIGNPQVLHIGQLVDFSDDNFAIDGQYMVVGSVSTERTPGIWTFDFELETKRGPQSWPEIMRRLLDIGKQENLAGELINRPVSHTDAVTCTYTVALT